MTDGTTITLWLEDGQDVDELIDAYLLEHPEDAGRDFLVIDMFSDDGEDSQEPPFGPTSKV